MLYNYIKLIISLLYSYLSVQVSFKTKCTSCEITKTTDSSTTVKII